MTVLSDAKSRLSNKSVLVPVDLLPKVKLDALRENALNELLIAAHLGMLGAHKIVVRDLRATDLAETNDVWQETTGATANAWEDSLISAQAIADARFVVIWGCTYNLMDGSTPAVTALRFTAGGAIVAIWQLDKLVNQRVKSGIALYPIIVEQNITITVEHYVKIVSSGVEIILEGAVAEKEALTLKSQRMHLPLL